MNLKQYLEKLDENLNISEAKYPTIEEVLLNYKGVRRQFIQAFKSAALGSVSTYFKDIGRTLYNFKNEEEITKEMKERGFPILSNRGPLDQIFQTIKQITRDLNLQPGDLEEFARFLAVHGNQSELLKRLWQKLAKHKII